MKRYLSVKFSIQLVNKCVVLVLRAQSILTMHWRYSGSDVNMSIFHTILTRGYFRNEASELRSEYVDVTMSMDGFIYNQLQPSQVPLLTFFNLT